MNYEILFRDLGDRQVQVALAGAAGGFSRTLLAQLRLIPRFTVAALCDLDTEAVLALLAELGYPPGAAVCDDAASVQAAVAAGRTVILRDHALLQSVPHDIVVDRVYVHGDASGQKRGIGLNARVRDATRAKQIARVVRAQPNPTGAGAHH